MVNTPRHVRRTLIALTAIVAASFGAGEASACSSMGRSRTACETVCGRCTSQEVDSLAAHFGGAISVAFPHASAVSRTGPAEDCACRLQAPAAPSPEPARNSAEHRAGLNEASACASLNEAFAACEVSIPQAPPQSPPRVPFYLRNSRLLF